jgi:hypothetical protein
MFGSNKAKKPKHDSHNQPRSPVYTMGRSRTSKLVSNNPYPFFKYHQNDKVAKTERLSIEGKQPVQLRYMSFFTLRLRYELY